MEIINPIAALIALIIAIFSIPKTLHAINEHKRKKFKDELENFKEYFANFHQNSSSNTPKLLKDKAAQNIARSLEMNADLLDYLITLHEKDLINFDKIKDHYYWGNRFIAVNKNTSRFQFSNKRGASRFLSCLNYFLYVIFITIAVFTFLGKIQFFNVQWLNNLIGAAHIFFAISFLRTADDMREALIFLKTMEKAETNLIETQSFTSLDNEINLTF